MEEKRRSHRRELSSKLIVKILGSTETEESVEIDITDVSKSGIGFSCDKELEVGTVYEAYLRIWTKEVLHTFVRVVRMNKTEEGYAYGGLFIGMTEMDASRIEAYDTVETLKANQEKSKN